MDLFSRKIVGWQIELASAALTMAIQQQRPQAGLIHHSDRGVQGGFFSKRGCDEDTSVRIGVCEQR